MAKKKTSTRRVRTSDLQVETVKRSLVEVTRYRNRKTGRFTRKRRGMKKEVYRYRTTEMGEFASGVIVPLEDSITKRVDEVDIDGWNGLLYKAMQEQNIFASVSSMSADMVDINLSGYYGKEKITIKKSLDLRDIRRRGAIGDLMVIKVLDRLSELGYRLDYPLEIVKAWSKKQTRLKDARAKRVLKKAVLTVRIRRS